MAYPKKAVSGLPKNAYVLTGKTDKPMELRTYQYYFESILRRCGIRKRSYRTLRHSLKRELQYPARVLKFSYKSWFVLLSALYPQESALCGRITWPSQQCIELSMCQSDAHGSLRSFQAAHQESRYVRSGLCSRTHRYPFDLLYIAIR